MNHSVQKIFSRIASIGAQPADDENTRLQKSLLVLSTLPFILTGILWGGIYVLISEESYAVIPFSYSIVSTFSLLYLYKTRRFDVFRFLQQLFILLLPFFMVLQLGGIMNSGVMILWSVISPLAAILFDKPKNALRWFVAFFFLLLLSGFLEPYFPPTNHMTAAFKIFFLALNLLAVCSLVFLMFFYFIREKNFFQKRSEELLLNILPWEIAQELKNTGTTVAKEFESATVLFTDFKNFTAISEKLNAQELVNEINFFYSAFDDIITKYGIEKIKTIGDSYMCAGGLPVVNNTHAIDCVNAALEMRDFMVKQKSAVVVGVGGFEIRIGIHTGPVVAGVVGTKKFAYDIWGDTVNIASRMESAAEQGKVNISGSTYALVKEKFQCVHRGKITAKNKGEIDMYFVDRSFSEG